MPVLRSVTRIGLTAAVAALMGVGLRHFVSLPGLRIEIILAVAIAVTVFGSRYLGASLLIPALLTCLPYRHHPYALLTCLGVALMAVSQVQLWSIWLPVTALPRDE